MTKKLDQPRKSLIPVHRPFFVLSHFPLLLATLRLLKAHNNSLLGCFVIKKLGQPRESRFSFQLSNLNFEPFWASEQHFMLQIWPISLLSAHFPTQEPRSTAWVAHYCQFFNLGFEQLSAIFSYSLGFVSPKQLSFSLFHEPKTKVNRVSRSPLSSLVS